MYQIAIDQITYEMFLIMNNCDNNEIFGAEAYLHVCIDEKLQIVFH